MIKIFQNFPCSFLNFITREYHIYARINRTFYFNSKNTCMPMKILSFALETIKTMCIL